MKGPKDLAELLEKDKNFDAESILKEVKHMADSGKFDNATEWAKLGRVLCEFECSPAVLCYQQVLKKRPDDEQANLQIAKILLFLGRTDKAEKFAAKAVQVNPASLEARQLLKEALLKNHKEADAHEQDAMIQQIQANAPQNQQKGGISKTSGTKMNTKVALDFQDIADPE